MSCAIVLSRLPARFSVSRCAASARSPRSLTRNTGSSDNLSTRCNAVKAMLLSRWATSVAFAAAWSLPVAAGQPETTPVPDIQWADTDVIGMEAPLFDTIDENYSPVSMAEMIDGKLLVLAVSSCS